MTANRTTVPVHESLRVINTTTLYQTEEWWKAVVTYGFEDKDAEETAVYLWHKDDDWNRKNKYVIKTPAAWGTDREIIDRFIRSDPRAAEVTEFPVSDYYIVGAGETVFQSDGWWKAIVNVVEKGDYETNEVMVYVWQEQEGDWRRRQKYTIKRVSDWEEERDAVENHLSMDASGDFEIFEESGDSTSTGVSPPKDGDEFAALDKELDAHLSGEFTDT